jgi:hypothetical protein
MEGDVCEEGRNGSDGEAEEWSDECKETRNGARERGERGRRRAGEGGRAGKWSNECEETTVPKRKSETEGESAKVVK